MSKAGFITFFFLVFLGNNGLGQTSLYVGLGTNVIKSNVEAVQISTGDVSKVLEPVLPNYSIGVNHNLKNSHWYIGILASMQSFEGRIEYSTQGSGPFRYSNNFRNILMIGPSVGFRRALEKKLYVRGELDMMLYMCRRTTNITNIVTKTWNDYPNAFVYSYKHEFNYNSGLNTFLGLKVGVEYPIRNSDKFTFGCFFGWGRSVYKNYDQLIRLKLDGRNFENVVRISNSGESFLVQIILNFNL